MKILIVESTSIARKKLRRILEELGHQVVGEAGSASEAITLCQRARPELVTVDIRLRDGDAGSLMKDLSREACAPLIIAVGTLANAFRVLPSRSAGAGHFLLKPFQRERVAEALERAEEYSLAA